MQIVTYISRHRTDPRPFDVMIGGQTPSESSEAAEIVRPYVEAGATWWSEELTGWRGPLDETRRRIQAGPPH